MANVVRKGDFHKFFRNRTGKEIADKLSNEAAALQWVNQQKPDHDVYTLAMGDAKALAKKAFGDRLKQSAENSKYYGHFQPADGNVKKHIFYGSRGEGFIPADYGDAKWSTARDAITKVWRDREQRDQVKEIANVKRSFFLAFVEILKDKPSAKKAVINFGKDRVAQYIATLPKG